MKVISISSRQPIPTRLSPSAISARQDFVDNKIHSLIESLSGRKQQWNLEVIAEVRDAVGESLQKNGLTTTDEYYPAFDDEDSDDGPYTLREGFTNLIADLRERPVLISVEFILILFVFLFILYGFPVLNRLSEAN